MNFLALNNKLYYQTGLSATFFSETFGPVVETLNPFPHSIPPFLPYSIQSCNSTEVFSEVCYSQS
jgi:hypothetical protein